MNYPLWNKMLCRRFFSQNAKSTHPDAELGYYVDQNRDLDHWSLIADQWVCEPADNLNFCDPEYSLLPDWIGRNETGWYRFTGAAGNRMADYFPGGQNLK